MYGDGEQLRRDDSSHWHGARCLFGPPMSFFVDIHVAWKCSCVVGD